MASEELKKFLRALKSKDKKVRDKAAALNETFLRERREDFHNFLEYKRLVEAEGPRPTGGAVTRRPCPMCQGSQFVYPRDEEEAVVVKEEVDIPQDEEEGSAAAAKGGVWLGDPAGAFGDGEDADVGMSGGVEGEGIIGSSASNAEAAETDGAGLRELSSSRVSDVEDDNGQEQDMRTEGAGELPGATDPRTDEEPPPSSSSASANPDMEGPEPEANKPIAYVFLLDADDSSDDDAAKDKEPQERPLPDLEEGERDGAEGKSGSNDEVPMETEEEEILQEVVMRSCAFCLLPLSPAEIRKCSKCQRRVYCSKECQTADWKGKGSGGGPVSSDKATCVGQGHKRWCGLSYGEEGIDWAIKEIPGKGRGLVALRDLPPSYRILVEGIQEFRHTGLAFADHPGFKTLRLPPPNALRPCPGKTETEKKFYANALKFPGPGIGIFAKHLGLRLALANHSCDANAYIYCLEHRLQVLCLISHREIGAGEEICILYNPYWAISPPPGLYEPYLPSPGTERSDRFSLDIHGIVCPPTCSCQDLASKSKLKEVSDLGINFNKELMAAIVTPSKSAQDAVAEKARRALELASELPAGKLTSWALAKLHYNAFLSCFQRKEYLEGKPHYKKMMEFSRAIEHPDSSMNMEKMDFVKRFRARCPELDT